jgi:hypothetical protein
MKTDSLKPWRYKSCQIESLLGWQDYGLKWYTVCNGVDILATSKVQMRKMISEQLDSDRIMGAL